MSLSDLPLRLVPVRMTQNCMHTLIADAVPVT